VDAQVFSFSVLFFYFSFQARGAQIMNIKKEKIMNETRLLKF